jgi:hypothetical protein
VTVCSHCAGLHSNKSRQAAYWIDYGRALTRLRGRHDDAVTALRRTETLSQLHTLRNPFIRDVMRRDCADPNWL